MITAGLLLTNLKLNAGESFTGKFALLKLLRSFQKQIDQKPTEALREEERKIYVMERTTYFCKTDSKLRRK